jgi:hypothetical protein
MLPKILFMIFSSFSFVFIVNKYYSGCVTPEFQGIGPGNPGSQADVHFSGARY